MRSEVGEEEVQFQLTWLAASAHFAAQCVRTLRVCVRVIIKSLDWLHRPILLPRVCVRVCVRVWIVDLLDWLHCRLLLPCVCWHGRYRLKCSDGAAGDHQACDTRREFLRLPFR